MRVGLELPILRGQSVPRGRVQAARGSPGPGKDSRPLRQSLYSHRTQSPTPNASVLFSTPDYGYLRAMIADLHSPTKLPNRRSKGNPLQFRYLYRLRLKKPTLSRPKQVLSLADMGSPLLIAKAHAQVPVNYQSRSLSVPRSLKPHLSVVLELPVTQQEPIPERWRVRLRDSSWTAADL